MAGERAVLEYLTTSKIGNNGQVAVPKQFREDLGLGTGALFAVLRLGDGLILVPEQVRFERLCAEVSSALTAQGIYAEDALAKLPEARQRIFERHYGRGSKEATRSPKRVRRTRNR